MATAMCINSSKETVRAVLLGWWVEVAKTEWTEEPLRSRTNRTWKQIWLVLGQPFAAWGPALLCLNKPLSSLFSTGSQVLAQTQIQAKRFTYFWGQSFLGLSIQHRIPPKETTDIIKSSPISSKYHAWPQLWEIKTISPLQTLHKWQNSSV